MTHLEAWVDSEMVQVWYDDKELGQWRLHDRKADDVLKENGYTRTSPWKNRRYGNWIKIVTYCTVKVE